MRIVIAGGHGKIALRLTEILARRGDQAVGLVRNPDHTGDVTGAGGEAAVVDLEHTTPLELAPLLQGADAVVFAAGAGPGSGIRRKDTVDRGAAVLLADAAERAGVRRLVLLSSMGVDSAHVVTDEVFAAYLRAKAAAEEDLRGRDLDWTILRPGGLTDDPGTGRVRLEPSVEPGQVTRDDVAAVLAGLLDESATSGLVLELVQGDDLVDAAVQAAAREEPGDGSATALTEG
ncbi:SDR family oxidoreductase [Actinotalea sp. K2]|uniref:SDR family oxidoreductase n=1 Tax=Actinotalea sp. K2 TaxID=2939438 RepID=UPI002017F2A6|nr:SDR family oxidoreductase [Actinotalea sp. K2]MCL3859731.1 SDR family oxidoreductase [Actinotalea sp. K2]